MATNKFYKVEDIKNPFVVEWNPDVPQTFKKILHGIDISGYQETELFDWELLKESIDFLYIKATEGVHWSSPGAEDKAKLASEFGIPYSHYHFATPGVGGEPRIDAVNECDSFLEWLAKNPGHTLPVMLDFEKNKEGLPKEKLGEWVSVFMEYFFSQQGYAPIFYSYYSFIKNNFTQEDIIWLSKYPLWLAYYVKDPENPGKNPPKMPPGFNEWLIWQYSSRKIVPGFPKPLDANFAKSSLLRTQRCGN